MKKGILFVIAALGLGPKGQASMMEKDRELIKIYKGRWELVGEAGEEKRKAEAVAPLPTCILKASDLKKKKGDQTVKDAVAALDELYAVKDKLQTATLFRQVEPSEEIVGVSAGNEFLIEKMFSTRSSLERTFPDKGDKSFALLKELARLCKS